MTPHTPAQDFSGPHWTPELLTELEQGRSNGRVGSRIVSESDRVRVWLIELQPGERLPFHTHVQDYFWTATTPGRARSRYADGRVAEVTYDLGDTRHFSFGKGESMTHDLENIGDSVLCFTTVEFFGSANPPLL
ncbi:hypothetical protein [Fuscovulum ytuae]|uniref:Cupin domain-containing protein n=1 Tax=Fuscovulum ytuae TaxID=3042299 RepID=A0ABY8QB49_9RHOB|nr:hypothetical protein [Fuscovulum sp. YMD61]WGV17929.1 hypothetical protein QF092_09165 [Fuscovulum sp. YMD61]